MPTQPKSQQWRVARGWLFSVFTLVGVFLPHNGFAQEGNLPTITGDVVNLFLAHTDLDIPERYSKIVQTKLKISRVDGFDPSVISVTALTPSQLRVQAITQGVTTVVITDESGAVFTLEVLVSGDARLLQGILKKYFPQTSVQAIKLRDNILLRGWVTEPQQITEIVEIAQFYGGTVVNQMKVGGPQQVQLSCKLLEVQRSKTRALGVNFSDITSNFGLSSTPGQINTLSSATVPFGGPPAQAFTGSLLKNATATLGVVGDTHSFQALIVAMRDEGLLKVHAEPTVLTRSGEPAKISSGGVFPIPVPGALGVVTIDWKEFGVKLESVPLVLSPHELKQTIVAEVSQKDLSSAVTLNGTTVPGLTKRSVETQVVMNFGQTLVIGGLISMQKISNTNKIPGLGELPGAGALFRKVSYSDAETELLVMITPTYVGTGDLNQLPAEGPGRLTTTPTDRELFCHGVMEVPVWQGDNCPPCGPNGTCFPQNGPAMSPANYPSPMTPGFQMPANPNMGPNGPGNPFPPPLSSDPGMIAPPVPAPAPTTDGNQTSKTKKSNYNFAGFPQKSAPPSRPTNTDAGYRSSERNDKEIQQTGASRSRPLR